MIYKKASLTQDFYILILVVCILIPAFYVSANTGTEEFKDQGYTQKNLVRSDIHFSTVTDENGTATSSGFYGDEIHVTGGGTTSGSQIDLYWDDDKPTWDENEGLLNTTTSNPDGTFEIWFNVPEVVYGPHKLILRENSTQDNNWYDFYVNATDPVPLDIGVETPGEIATAEEVDGYSFNATYGLYTIETKGTEIDTYMHLINSSCETVIETDDDDGEGYNSLIVFNCKEPGTYFVNVHSYSFDYAGNYSIIVQAPEFLISHFNYAFRDNDVNMIYPAETTPKPLGCSAASVSDWLASSYIYMRLGDCVEGQDVEPDFVNQTTGAPVGEAGKGIITFGGPFVNPVVKRAEDLSTPSEDRAPIKFYDEAGQAHFRYANGTIIPNATLPWSHVNNDKDLFVIEVYEDSDARFNMICYGFGWKGTYAAGKFFHTDIWFRTGNYPHSWMIVKWEDANGNGFVNNEADGDTYTIIATG